MTIESLWGTDSSWSLSSDSQILGLQGFYKVPWITRQGQLDAALYSRDALWRNKRTKKRTTQAMSLNWVVCRRRANVQQSILIYSLSFSLWWNPLAFACKRGDIKEDLPSLRSVLHNAETFREPSCPLVAALLLFCCSLSLSVIAQASLGQKCTTKIERHTYCFCDLVSTWSL